ncbi:glycosyltransferase [Parasphingopyxis sp. CP4]|uniref:glycosyltransferase family 2 protein n=1 Tax=Parasphingopyxis sp. CP4 TaxID=2724527 RepID=UPI0015A187A3|nr:glycosyltransferase [Parasphingopyxis sp. CP4]QLC22455.1 glycosyltransferase [Parasphingopyxis sp. CP4]
MKIVVGIPTFRRPELLEALLRSLEKQERLDGIDVDILVADNDGEDRHGVLVCERLAPDFVWPLSHIIVDARGLTAVRNAILQSAEGSSADYLAMVDDDERAEPQWLRELLDQAQNLDADIVGGPVLYEYERPPESSMLVSGAFPDKHQESGKVRMIEATGNVLISLDALKSVGFPKFDPKFGLTGGEDKEFFTRLRHLGLTFAWADNAIAHEHVPPERTTLGWVMRRAFRTGNCDYRITRLHDGNRATVVSLLKALAVLLTMPLLALLLIVPNLRIWLLRRWSRAMGKICGAIGGSYEEYSLPDGRSSPKS